MFQLQYAKWNHAGKLDHLCANLVFVGRCSPSSVGPFPFSVLLYTVQVCIDITNRYFYANIRNKDCKTRYYHNYYVTSASLPIARRVFYDMSPSVLEIADHFFVDTELCHWIEAEFAFSQYVAMSSTR
jgi:hypothetical protein